MTEERCDLTDLLAAQCGCKTHRGGQTPQEEAAASTSASFSAYWAGICAGCGESFEEGAALHRTPGGYLAECCWGWPG